MACQKVCKQGRNDITVKLNLQSPIPASFYIYSCKLRDGTKPGLWTLDWTMDWTMDWIMDSILDSIGQ